MKKTLLLLTLLSFILADDETTYPDYPYYKECPSVNIGRSDGIVNCPDSDQYYCKPLFDENYEDVFYWYQNEDDPEDPAAAADVITIDYCRSQHLYNRKVGNEAMYYNKCCLLKFQYQGTEYYHCVGLTDDQMMDVPVTIKELEDEFGERTGNDMYIKSLNCKGEYIFYSMISILLLALIL